jgi:ABC-2 type transport system permease protein
MRALLKLLYKDFLVIIRDRGGLAMLFLMPLTLVLIMTSLQDTTFRSLKESGVHLILLNNDNDSLGLAIGNELARSKLFTIHQDIEKGENAERRVKEAVAMGRYLVGVVIPEHATQHIRERVQKNVALTFLIDSNTLKPDPDSVFIKLYIDPATKNSFLSTLQGSIHEYAARVESRIVLNELTNEINKYLMIPVTNLNIMKKQTIFYKEEYAAIGDKKTIPNSAQHNIPAWTLFAMFFIVIPFASGMIKEREDGNIARLLTMPCSYASILISKLLVYMAVCFLQFGLILLMGLYLFPLMKLTPLTINGHLISLSLLAGTAALAAIGYGISIGTIARTHQQAAIFASISVVILAALGGIWVPVFMMPPLFRKISIVSPLNWGLNGFYDILIRNSTLKDVIHYGIWMLLFSIACLMIAIYFERLRKEHI